MSCLLFYEWIGEMNDVFWFKQQITVDYVVVIAVAIRRIYFREKIFMTNFRIVRK